MHGIIGVALPGRNRKGRKRKQRIKLAGKIAMPATAEVVNYRALAAMQPHRRHLPERFRDDDRAGTELGNLLLTGQLDPPGRNGNPSGEALKLYNAGIDYAKLVGAYQAVINSPRGTAGSGRGYSCGGDEFCNEVGNCECLRRKQAYNDAYLSLLNTTSNVIFGHKVLKIVKMVCVYDQPCGEDNLTVLRMGLRVLTKYFEDGRR